MIRYFFLLILALSVFGQERHYLSICTIFQNEAPYLKEWIEYHRLMGVSHFYLYNNRSEDHFREVLAPYVEQGIAELKDWPPFAVDLSREQTLQEWRQYQPAAYNDCIQSCSSDWLAVIDVDEFIVPMKHPDLLAYLSTFDRQEEIGGIRINWQIYGTSKLPNIPEGQLLIESLLWKAKPDYFKNQMVKLIVRPKAIRKMMVHYAEYKEGYSSWPNYSGRSQPPLWIDEIRINHYWTRAEDFFYSVKGGRLLKKHEEKYQEVVDRDAKDLNLIYDPLLLPLAPRLKEILRY